MRDIPYESNPGNACALACYTMVARYYFPEISFEEMGVICDYEPGYVIWPFKFWLWAMKRGIYVTDYDIIDYHAWAKQGIEGLKNSISEKEFDYIKTNTKNFDAYPALIEEVLENDKFTYNREKPSFKHLEKEFNSGAICEVVLDAGTLNHEEEFALHRVVIIDITDNEIVFHDPQKNPRPARRESRDHFINAWQKAPELCIYKK